MHNLQHVINTPALSVCLCLSDGLSAYLIALPVCLSAFLSVCTPICLSVLLLACAPRHLLSDLSSIPDTPTPSHHTHITPPLNNPNNPLNHKGWATYSLTLYQISHEEMNEKHMVLNSDCLLTQWLWVQDYIFRPHPFVWPGHRYITRSWLMQWQW